MSFSASIINERYVAVETVALANADTALGSMIDWTKVRAPISIIINDGAETLAGACSVDLEYTADGGGSWADLDSAYVADITGVRVFKVLDPDVVGYATGYRLSFDSVADDSLNTIVVKVISDPLDQVERRKS